MTNIGYTMKKGLRHRFRKRLKRMTACQGVDCILAQFKTTQTNYEVKKSDYQNDEPSGGRSYLLLERLMVSIFISSVIVSQLL